ncbi:MAG TPA: hypothetical protein VLT47_16020 [Anaeromyxobacteraceae bacterium]|nr:hypothetical protein [Anaeromyxobacteraceae bacterium]
MSMIRRALPVALALAAAGPAAAFDVGDGLLSVSGFGRWGYGETDGNAYLLGRDGGKGDNIGMALNVFARPMDRLAVSTQFFYDASRVNIDWAFAEYRVEDWLRFRAGQVKMPFTAYMETKDVGTLRPFYNLPASVYSFSDLSAESYFGVGLTGFVPPMAGWELSYDVFFGQIWLESSDRFRPAPAALNLTAASQAPYANPAAGRQTLFTRVDDTIGARLTIGTPVPGLKAYLSGYSGTVADLGSQLQGADPGSNLHAAGLSLEYVTERYELRAEGFNKRAKRGGSQQLMTAGYVEAAVRLPFGFQLAGRAESATYDLHDDTVATTVYAGTPPAPTYVTYTIPNSLRRHLEYAVGLNYWFDPNFVVKCSYHWIDGNRFAVPEQAWNNYTTDGNAPPASLPDVTYDAKTQMLVVGAQFAF